ncbi:transposase [Elioraea sp.]|uniref:transposase n=1 Tax=Elioraea sp. TaxID=2185103 RepID=UPI0038D13082
MRRRDLATGLARFLAALGQAVRRRVPNAIFWIARSGAPWRDLPAEPGTRNSVFRMGPAGRDAGSLGRWRR